MTRVISIVLGTLVGGYVLVCALLFFGQRTLLYPAPTERATPTGRARVEPVPGGTHLLWREAGPGGPVVVHFHGNGEQVAWLAWLAEAYAERGVSFAAVEYPGYPGALGSPSEAGIMAAAEAALAHLTGAMGVERSRVVLSGQSLGTGVAVALAAKGWGRRLVLLSPYTALPEVGARAFPAFPVRLLMRDRFDSLARAAAVQAPTLVLHGTRDEVVPFDLGETLAKALPRAEFVAVEGAGHNTLWDGPGVTERVLAFVAAP